MTPSPARRQIIARYSALKVGVWVALVGSVCVWTLADGASRGWRLPEGRYGALFPEAVVGSVLGLVVSVAIVLNIALARGVAIAKVGEDFVFCFPFGRKRVALHPGISVTSTQDQIEAPAYGTAGWFFRVPAVIANQVTIHRPGTADVNFRTGLLRDRSEVIADRMSALIRNP